jgi:transposase
VINLLPIRVPREGGSGRKSIVTRRQLTDEQWKLIEPFLPIGEYGPYPERLRDQFEGVIWRFRTSSQWREMPGEFGPWPTVYGRFRVWRDAGVFTALLEGLIAEAARQGQTDLSLVSVDSTTARAHHDAAGLRIGNEVMEALEEATIEQERARQKGAARQNRTDSTAVETPVRKSGGTSGDGASSA